MAKPMLTDEQIDYLFQIKASKPPIPFATVRVMLGALRWTAEEIERGIAFLKRPAEAPSPPERPRVMPAPEDSVVEPDQPIVIKQNPFPVGSPFAGVLKKEEAKKHNRLAIAGAIIGAIVFIAGVLLYARFAGVV